MAPLPFKQRPAADRQCVEHSVDRSGAQNTSKRTDPVPPPPLCDMPSGCGFLPGPCTVARSSLRVLRRVTVPPPPSSKITM